MNDFLIGLGVAIGGSFLTSNLDNANTTKQQQASCASLGGTWQVDSCVKSGQPIATAYTMYGPAIDLGIPLAAAILLTRSLPGGLGAAVGIAGMFLVGISGIH